MTWDKINGEYVIYQSEINGMQSELRCPGCGFYTDDGDAVRDVREVGRLIEGTCVRCNSRLVIIVDDKRVE